MYDEAKGQWVSKEDVGVESMTEKTKGEASDSFKRACFNWGIGRELYEYPLIQIKLREDEFEVDAGGKAKQTYNLKMREWKWANEFDENGKLVALAAKDGTETVRFKFGEFSKK